MATHPFLDDQERAEVEAIVNELDKEHPARSMYAAGGGTSEISSFIGPGKVKDRLEVALAAAFERYLKRLPKHR